MKFLKLGSVLAIALVATITQKVHAAAWTYSSATTTPATCVGLDSTGSATDFQITAVVNKATNTAANMMKMAFVVTDTMKLRTNPTAHADFVYVERFGLIYYYSDSLKTTTQIGTIAPDSLSYATEDGLVGVAVDRVFQNRVFLNFAHSASGCLGGTCTGNTAINGSWRVEVFPMDPVTHMINIAGGQVVIDIPTFRNRWHTAGAMNMDQAGNLYIDVGDNETAFTGPGNLKSLRGDILRIHPNAGVTGGYTIPSGNLWEVASQIFTNEGRATLASQYQDTSKVKREIYVKGTRNAYVAQVNPYNGVLTYSQCGPDAQDKQSESWNLLGSPRFAGWPFWVGTDSVNSSQVGSSQYGKNGSNEPTTGTWNTYLPGRPTGVTWSSTSNVYPDWTLGSSIVNTWRKDTVSGFGEDTLPPYIVQTNAESHSAGGSCSMGATLWYYDGRVANPNKLPPQMNNVWFNGAYTAQRLQGTKITMDTVPSLGITGKMLGTMSTMFSGLQSTASAATIEALLDVQEGPDGALYVLNNNCTGGTGSGTTAYSDNCSGIARIEFKSATSASACSDPNFFPTGAGPKAFVPVGNPSAIERQDKGAIRSDVYWLSVGAKSFSITAEGPHQVQIVDLHGRVLNSINGTGPQSYSFPSNLSSKAVYFLRVKTNEGTVVRGFLPF